MRFLADDGFNSITGYSIVGTVLGGLITLFVLLVNALLKVGRRSDEVNTAAIDDKNKTIKERDERIDALIEERDYWFNRYDELRSRYGAALAEHDPPSPLPESTTEG